MYLCMSTKLDTKVYEASFHIASDQKDAQVESIFASIKEYIEKNGTIIEEHAPEKVDLAYTMFSKFKNQDGQYLRYDSAFFSSIKFKSSPEVANTLRTMLQESEHVIRFIILNTIEQSTRIGDILPGEEPEEESSDKEEVLA